MLVSLVDLFSAILGFWLVGLRQHLRDAIAYSYRRSWEGIADAGASALR